MCVCVCVGVCVCLLRDWLSLIDCWCLRKAFIPETAERERGGGGGEEGKRKAAEKRRYIKTIKIHFHFFDHLIAAGFLSRVAWMFVQNLMTVQLIVFQIFRVLMWLLVFHMDKESLLFAWWDRWMYGLMEGRMWKALPLFLFGSSSLSEGIKVDDGVNG